jgi:MGT family glycosyltransferase
MATIGVMHFGARGHVAPALRLARVLAATGHRLVHWAPEEYRAEVEGAGGELRPFGESVQPLGTSLTLADLQVGLAFAAVEATPAAVDGLHAEGVELVINDAQAPWARIAADWLGLPRICSWPLFPPAGRRPGVHLGNDPSGAHADALRRCREAIGRRWGVELGTGADGFGSLGDLNLAYTTREVAGGDHGPEWRFAGPLMDDSREDADAIVGGDERRPLVYAALGTIFTGNAALFRAIMEALADEPVRVLISTWGQLSADDLAPVPENVVVAARVDSRSVLRRAAVHICHGGAGSAHESVVEGVPMLFVPQGADQLFWTERLVALGAGVRADDESPESIRAGVLRLLDDVGTRERTRALGARLREHDGAGIAVRAVEEVLT